MTKAKNASTSSPSSAHEHQRSWSATTRLVVLVFSLITVLWLAWLARPFWWLLILSFILAYLLQPVINGLTRLKIPRALATGLAVILALVVVLSILLVLIPSLLIDLQPLRIDVPGWWAKLVLWVQSLPQTLPGITVFGQTIDFTPFYDQINAGLSQVDVRVWLPSPGDWINVLNQALRNATNVLGIAANLATSVAALATAALAGLLLLLIFTIYLSKDLPVIFEAVIDLAPSPYQKEWQELWRRTGAVWHAFFRGQLILSLVVGVSVWIGLRIIGVSGALALGLIAGILEILPNIGPILALIPGLIMALLGGSTIYPEVPHLSVALAVLILYFLIQQLENYILVPRILGESVGVHPVVVMAGVLIFAYHFGVLGAFLAAPVLATLGTWGKYIYRRLQGQYPYPELQPVKAQPSTPAPPPAPAADTVPRAAATAPTVRLQRPTTTPPLPHKTNPDDDSVKAS